MLGMRADNRLAVAALDGQASRTLSQSGWQHDVEAPVVTYFPVVDSQNSVPTILACETSASCPASSTGDLDFPPTTLHLCPGERIGFSNDLEFNLEKSSPRCWVADQLGESRKDHPGGSANHRAAARLRFFPIWRVHPGLAVAATNSGYPFSICQGSIFSFAWRCQRCGNTTPIIGVRHLNSGR